MIFLGGLTVRISTLSVNGRALPMRFPICAACKHQPVSRGSPIVGLGRHLAAFARRDQCVSDGSGLMPSPNAGPEATVPKGTSRREQRRPGRTPSPQRNAPVSAGAATCDYVPGLVETNDSRPPRFVNDESDANRDCGILAHELLLLRREAFLQERGGSNGKVLQSIAASYLSLPQPNRMQRSIEGPSCD